MPILLLLRLNIKNFIKNPAVPLTNAPKCFNILQVPCGVRHGGVAQLGERTVRIRKVESSILFVSTKNRDTALAVSRFF